MLHNYWIEKPSRNKSLGAERFVQFKQTNNRKSFRLSTTKSTEILQLLSKPLKLTTCLGNLTFVQTTHREVALTQSLLLKKINKIKALVVAGSVLNFYNDEYSVCKTWAFQLHSHTATNFLCAYVWIKCWVQSIPAYADRGDTPFCYQAAAVELLNVYFCTWIKRHIHYAQCRHRTRKMQKYWLYFDRILVVTV